MAETKPVQSLLRGIDLLELLTEAPQGMRLSDIAQTMGLKAPTVHNLVKTLAGRGLIEKRSGNRYVAGVALLDLADRFRTNARQLAAEDVVRRLAQHDLQPVVNYTIPSGSRLAVRLRMSPDRPRVMQRPSNQDNGLYGSATGLAFLAFAAPDRVLALRQAHPFHEEGIRLWESWDALAAFLSATRKNGVSVTPFAGQAALRVAAPVFDRDGAATSFIGVSVAADQATTKRAQKSIITAVQAAAEELSQHLQGTGI